MYNMETAKNIDLEALGLSELVKENTKRNRMSTVQLCVTDQDGNPVENANIEVRQTKNAFKFGCNAFMATQFEKEEENKLYDSRFQKIFNQAVVPFYWRDDEPEKGKYRFKKGSPYIYRRPPADDVLDWCERLDIEPKAHNMIWLNRYAGLPKWMPVDKTKMQKAIDDRIKMLADLYADKIPVWDVTNEVSASDKYEVMPADFEVRAHKLADELFPDNHLIFNDYYGFYNDRYKGKRSTPYLFIQKILANGGRIDGIGIQHHLFIKEEDIKNDDDKLRAEHFFEMLSLYSALNKDLHISEITVPSYDKTEEKLEVQAKIVENFYRIWFSTKNVKSIVWWNLVDGCAFVNPENPSWSEDYYSGGLLNRDFTEKPAYKVLDKLINQEWKTICSATAKDGKLTLDMFHGDYEITVNGIKVNTTVKEDTSILKLSI